MIRALLIACGLIGIALIGTLAAMLVWQPHASGIGSLRLPDASLTDDGGKPFTFSQLRGTPYALFFGYTHCPDTCPTTLAKLEHARQELSAQTRDTTKIVFVTVDPQRDTPATMHRYVSLFGTGVIGVTGPSAELQRVYDSLGVWAQRIGKGRDYEMGHTSSVFFVDAAGRFRSLHDWGDPPATFAASFKELT